MTDADRLRDRFHLLAARGTRRGAGEVIAAARASASGEGAPPQADLDGDVDHDDVEVVELEPSGAPRRHAAWRVLAAAGVAALTGVGVLAISALVGGGGASSPEEAVRNLAEAVNSEDPLAAAGALAPEEVRTLRRTLDGASRKAAELELVESASAPLAGIDVEVSGLELATEELAPGYAKVTIVDGELTGQVDSEGLSDLVQRAGADDVQGSVTAAELRAEDVQPFVVAVERDGGWYVSAAYTALEYMRVLNDLPPADYGSGLARAATLGAASPDEAARQMISALGATDWETAFSLVPPDEIALYDYREGLSQLLADNGGFTVDSIDTKSQIDGDTAVVEVRASGGLPSADEYSPDRWELSDGCFRESFPTYADTYAFADADGDHGSMEAPPVPDSTEMMSLYCNSGEGAPMYFFFGGTGTQPVDPEKGVELMAVQLDGRWFLSPVSILLDTLDGWVGAYDSRSLYSMLGLAKDLPPEAHLTLGEPYTGESAGAGLSYTFTFDGTAGQKIVGRLRSPNESESSMGFGFSGSSELYGPDGVALAEAYLMTQGMPATLPHDGTYTLVARPYEAGPYELTLWDADDAPEGVIDPDPYGLGEDCTVPEDGAMSCSFAETGSGIVVGGSAGSGICVTLEDGTEECTSGSPGEEILGEVLTEGAASCEELVKILENTLTGAISACSEYSSGSAPPTVPISPTSGDPLSETATTVAGAPGG